MAANQQPIEHAVHSDEVTVIEPPSGWSLPDFKELWRYRDLIYLLSRREIVVRHQQAVVGIIWALAQPLMLAGLFAVFLGLVAKVDGPEGTPYPLYCVVGLVAWLAFTKTLDTCTTSTIQYEPLITKIYLPRIAIPLTTIAVPILDLVLGFVVVLAMSLAYGEIPGPEIIFAPPILVLELALAIGFGLWLSALNVKYRDFGLLMPNLLLAGLFITPITYPIEQVPDNLQMLYGINPMVGVLEVFRWSVIGTELPGIWPYLLAVPLIMTPILLLSGALYFERASKSFADVI